MSQKTKVYSIEYSVKDKDGKLLDESERGQPLLFMEGSRQIIPALEDAVKKLKKGEKKDIHLKAKEAYGDVDKSAVIEVPLNQLPPTEKLKVGDHFWAETEHGRRPFRVIGVTSTHATMDGNHPLAGQDLSFTVTLVEEREATAEEMTHGHAHGAGGHHH